MRFLVPFRPMSFMFTERKYKSFWRFAHGSQDTFFFFAFMWPCIVTNFFLIKPTDAVFHCTFGTGVAKTGHSPRSSNCCVVLCIVCFVSFYVLFVCKCVLLPPGDNPTAVNKYIISYHVIKPAWHITVPNVQWKTPDDGQRNCPKHVEFLDKNKSGELVRVLVLLTLWRRNFLLNFSTHCI